MTIVLDCHPRTSKVAVSVESLVIVGSRERGSVIIPMPIPIDYLIKETESVGLSTVGRMPKACLNFA